MHTLIICYDAFIGHAGSHINWEVLSVFEGNPKPFTREGILQQLTQRSFEAHESRVTKATKALLATADHDILAKEYAGKRYFYYKKPSPVSPDERARLRASIVLIINALRVAEQDLRRDELEEQRQKLARLQDSDDAEYKRELAQLRSKLEGRPIPCNRDIAQLKLELAEQMDRGSQLYGALLQGTGLFKNFVGIEASRDILREVTAFPVRPSIRPFERPLVQAGQVNRWEEMDEFIQLVCD